MRRLAIALLLLTGCGDADPDRAADSGRSDGGSSDAGASDAGSSDGGSSDGGSRDGGGRDAAPVDDAGGRRDAALPDGSVPSPGAIRFVRNAPGEHEYGLLAELPPGFGAGDFTLEVWIRPDGSFPVGPTSGGEEQLTNWAAADVRPYSASDWWYSGNFLLDGHNNASFGAGTFSFQFYGGGRVRWLVGDAGDPGPGNIWSSGAFPASTVPSLLDDVWHRLAVVRRSGGASGADLELWIDGALISTERTTERTDLASWFDGWDGFPPSQEGWFFGAEKQAAIGVLSQYEDYKGDMAELRFWTIPRVPSVLRDEWDRAITGTEPGLAGWFRFDEGGGDRACDSLEPSRCIALFRFRDELWLAAGPALRP